MAKPIKIWDGSQWVDVAINVPSITGHADDTTNIHGIADTANLVYTNDSRLTDSRTPTAHATSHESGGTDEIEIAQSQVTNLTTDLSNKVDKTGGSIITVSSGSDVPLTIQNNGTGNSFVVNDVASDTTPFVINASGNVGIGVSSPTRPLHVSGVVQSSGTESSSAVLNGGTADGAALQLNRGGSVSQNAYVAQYQGSLFIKNLDSGSIVFTNTTSDTERMRIDSSGRITTPSQPAMHLDGNFNGWSTWGTTVDQVMTQFYTDFSRGGMSHNGSGRITVPVSGYYLVYFQVYVASTNQGRASLKRNGTSDIIVGQFAGSSADRIGFSSTVISCSANDYLEVVGTAFDPISVYMGSRHTFFGAYLIG